MEFNFSAIQDAVQSPSLSLYTVYVVLADHTYNVKKNSSDSDRWVIVRTLSGMGIVETIDQRYELSSGTLILLNYGDIMHYFPQNDHWHFWWFEFTCNSPIIDKENIYYLPLFESELTQFNNCLLYLRHPWSRDHASTLFLSCLFEWRNRIQDIGLSRYMRIFEEADKWMHENISAFHLQTLAKSLQISDRTLRTVFKSIAGLSPKAYFDNLRIQKGAQMLRTTLLNISEISEALGFSSPYHFSRAFSQYYQIPPKSFRNQS